MTIEKNILFLSFADLLVSLETLLVFTLSKSFQPFLCNVQLVEKANSFESNTFIQWLKSKQEKHCLDLEPCTFRHAKVLQKIMRP